MGQQKIIVKDLHFAYPDGYEAIKNVSFSIGCGESIGIIGANGAGKSTLLMLLMGVLFPDHGEIHLDEIPITKKTLSIVRQKMGMVFQNPDEQLFMTKVYDDVAFGPRNYKLDEKEVHNRVEMALNMVGIQHLRDKAPYKLSGGEKKAAAIASVLSMNPEILIMDEPTAALDPKSRRRIMNLLQTFAHTKIITSHDLDMVFEVCSRILIMKDGHIAADGSTEEILTNEELLEKCGLELPLSIQSCPICNSKKKMEGKV